MWFVLKKVPTRSLTVITGCTRAVTCVWLQKAGRKIRNKVPEALANVFVSRIGGFFETDEISSIVLTSSAQLSHFALQICGDACKAQDLG